MNEVVEAEDGTLHNKMVAKQDNVTQTLGMSPEDFAAMGMPSRDTPDCDNLRGE